MAERDCGGSVRLHIDDRHEGGYIAPIIPIGPRVGQVVRHEHRLTVWSDGRGDRFANGRHA